MSALHRARAILAAAVKLPAESLPADATVQTLAAWDSIAHVHVILALERSLGRELTVDEIVGLNSLADIATTLDGTPGPSGSPE